MSVTRLAGALAFALLAWTPALPAATITIVNNDAVGEGFNDPTVVEPVGGNPGTTLGAQRLTLFEFAADVWGALLESSIEIQVRANFNPLTCDENGAILGSAGALNAFANFANAPVADTWFHVALANSIAGTDLDTAAAIYDISAQFNSSIDSGCLPGAAGWYYGLDGDVPGNRLALFSTVLHEIGHGLGFANFVDESTGAFAGTPGRPDIYTVFTLDTSTGEHWDEMSTNKKRKDSALRTNQVVWDGAEAVGAVPDFLGPMAELFVNAPGGVAGSYLAAGAEFGGAISDPGLTADLELVSDGSADPTFGCGALVGFTPGNIAFVDRGTCEFGTKALNAENAGAVAVVIANNADGDQVFGPGPGAVGGAVTIPVAMIGQNDGNTLRPALPGNATLSLHPTALSGADASDQPYLYAPDPLETGSSISHWDVSASPNLLMEPFDNADVFAQVDLTIPMFRDIGWTANTYPTALPDGFAAFPDTELAVAAPGVLANDVDNGPPADLTAELATCCAEGGSVSLAADGSFTYDPPAAFEGTDSFTYHATDTAGDSFDVTVTIVVSLLLFEDDFEEGDTTEWSNAVP